MNDENIKLNIKRREKRKLNNLEYNEIEKQVLAVDIPPDLQFFRDLWETICDLYDENEKLKKKLKK